MLAAIALAIALAVGGAGCFDPEIPDVPFGCGPGGACPAGFACGADGCCRREGAPPPDGPSECLPVGDGGLDAAPD